MYEFDEDRWDVQESEMAEAMRIVDGWLIQTSPSSSGVIFRANPKHASEPKFLQIATGQWCSAEYATLFPLMSAAETYAKEFGFDIGTDVKIVRHRF